MKKILLLLNLIVLVSSTMFSQVPRKVLFEEFSGENCPPCATINPYVTALAELNKDKVILVKYQVPIPSAGPIYNQWTAASSRSSFYSVTSAPWGQQDGEKLTASNQHPGNWTQAKIDARFAIQSPVSINANFNFSSNRQKIIFNYSIKNETSAAVTGTYTTHVVLIEKLMKYPTAPGTNGETEFHHVARYMHPSTAGLSTTIPASGQTLSKSDSFNVPTYIRSIGELALVIFVQNSATKEVIQAAIVDEVYPQNYSDASLKAFPSKVTDYCPQTEIPKFRIYNKGSKAITSAKVFYKINTDSLVYNFSGNILPKDSSNEISLASVNLLPNQFTVFQYGVLELNGGADENINNNTTAAAIYSTKITDTITTSNILFSENFENRTLGSRVFDNGGTNDLSSGAFVVDKTVNSSVSQKLGAFGRSDKAYRILPFRSSSISVMFNKLNFTNIKASDSDIYFKFSSAYARFSDTTDDVLNFEISTDCGVTWNLLAQKTASELATGNNNNQSFYYPSILEWRTDSVKINGVKGKSKVMIRLKVVQGDKDAGNSLYMDDLSIYKVKSSGGATNDIVGDTFFQAVYNANNLGVKDSLLSSLKKEITSTVTNFIAGESVKWEVVNVALPSNWSLVSVCDNVTCYTYPTTKSQTFSYKDINNGGNYIKVDIAHRRNPGYGFVNIKVFVTSKPSTTTKIAKYALLVSNSSSIVTTVTENELFTYFDKMLFIDKKFKNSIIMITDMSGRTVKNALISGDTYDVNNLTKGIYIANVITEGKIVKTRKFIVE
jgi:hypothetical protein